MFIYLAPSFKTAKIEGRGNYANASAGAVASCTSATEGLVFASIIAAAPPVGQRANKSVSNAGYPNPSTGITFVGRKMSSGYVVGNNPI